MTESDDVMKHRTHGAAGSFAPRFLVSASLNLTVVDHLQIEGLSFVDVVQVFHGDDEAQFQNGQACNE